MTYMEMARWLVYCQIVRDISSPNVLRLFRLCALLSFCPFRESNPQQKLVVSFDRKYQLAHGLLGCSDRKRTASIECNGEEADEPCGDVPCHKLGHAENGHSLTYFKRKIASKGVVEHVRKRRMPWLYFHGLCLWKGQARFKPSF